MRVMVIAEHQSVCDAIAALGLDVETVIVEADDLPQRMSISVAPLAVGWSPRERLILRPEYAWLPECTNAFVQLPSPLGHLTSQIEHAQQQGNSAPAYCFRALGQLQWALDQMRTDIEAMEWKRSTARMAELQRFCASHWHGWHDRCLEDLDRALYRQEEDAVVRCVERICDAAGPVAVFQSFSEFFHGAGRDIVNGGAGPLRAMCKFYRTVPEPSRPNTLNMLLERLRENSDWWTSIQDELTTVAARLNDVRECGFEPEEVLRGRLGQALDGLAQFVPVAEGLLNAPSQWESQIADAEDALARIITAIKSIESDANVLRDSLSGGASATSTVSG